MKPMLPKDHHCCHRIVNVGIDAVVAILANGPFFFWWRFWPRHRHLMAPLVPFKCLQMWPPMAIANDESHWRQWWWGAPFVPSALPMHLPLATMDLHLFNFCRHWQQWHQWRDVQFVITLLPVILLRYTNFNGDFQKMVIFQTSILNCAHSFYGIVVKLSRHYQVII